MARGRGHRANLEEIGQELNLIPYLDIMVNLVLFLLITITSFLSFTVLNASIPQLTPDAAEAIKKQQKAQLLLMIRVTDKGFLVEPDVQGAKPIPRSQIPKKEGEFDYESLNSTAKGLKEKFPDESKVLIVSEPKVMYDEIIKTMDALRGEADVEKQEEGDLFPDVTLSIL